MTGALLAALLLQGGVSAVVSYDVTCGPRCAQLQVEAALPAPIGARLEIDDGVGAFVRDAQYEDGGRWVDAVVRGDEVLAAGCRQRPCRVRYRVLLADAARTLKDRGRAIAQEGIVTAPPASWLLRPARPEGGERFRLRVTSGGDGRVATGLFAGAPGTYEGALADLEQGPHSAFGAFTAATVPVGGRTVEVAIAPALAPHRREIVAWVTAAAKDVAGFFGRYPVPRALVVVLGGRRPGVSFGSAIGSGGASILVYVSPSAAGTLAKDAVLVHEMIHFGLPTVSRKHRWFEEGIATYAEPVVRAGGGRLSPAEVWGLLLDGLPRAVPGRPAGLDSGTWESTYWGGALFAFLADVGIRERTGNRKSLRDALRGIQAEGGSIAARWPLQRALAVGDAATGTTVMRDLHDTMGRRIEVDLRGLWKRLGVAREGGAIAFDDQAPLARVRRGITDGAKGRR